jgi:hypothetical protein
MSDQVFEQLEREGYFNKASQGDERGASLFARALANRLNPTLQKNGWGRLRKTAGGKNVDGYSEDAIVLGNDSMNFRNVVDVVQGAGASGARMNRNLTAFVNRRAEDVWEEPLPLTQDELRYLGIIEGGGEQPKNECVKECKFQTQTCKCEFRNYDGELATIRDELAQTKALLTNISDRLSQGLAGRGNVRFLGAVDFIVKG